MLQKLIIITGSPCVGKTTVAEELFESFHNCAHFDGDWVWRVNPFSIQDPRLRNGNKAMSFVLSNYLNSDFDYVFFTSIVVLTDPIRQNILNDITAKNYTTFGFTLKCSEETLTARHKNRGDRTEIMFNWLHTKPHPSDHIIITDNKTPAQIAEEIKKVIL
ncbi:MAG: AAA family ATPase [Clostridiales bacterium]|jgi:chloramphenicol 3-O-phosphotransferase|nr:AAA family ATPase [Clostridiales bacterium]